MLWGQMHVIGCLNKSQHGSRSTRFPFKCDCLSFENDQWTACMFLLVCFMIILDVLMCVSMIIVRVLVCVFQ